MSARLTVAQCEARAEAYREAADHLELNWTDDPLEYDEGARISRRLRSEETRWRDRAIDMSRAALPRPIP